MKRRIEQVRRRWWVVLLIAALATAAAVIPALQAHATYVATSTLVQSSPNLAPEQNATMAVGYATLFNEPATIGRLRAAREIPDDVTFEARTVAASPILTIQATAADPSVAQDAAENMADAFRSDINAARQASFERPIQDTERQLDSLISRREPDGQMNPLVPILQGRLDAMRAEAINQLRNLQLRAGVTESKPDIVFQLGKGAVGGVLLGIVAALGLAAVSQRLDSSADLLDKTGIEPLVEVPGGNSIEAIRLREDRLRTLANIVSLQDLPKSAVVALTDCRGAHAAQELAESVARLSALKGYRTVLVYANNDALQPTNYVGFNEALADSSLINYALVDGPVESLKVLPAGSVVADRYPLISRERIDEVVDELRMGADTIVIAAPPITDTHESQLICAAADFTMLVVDRKMSRSADATSAAEALADAHANLLGAVMVDGTSRR